MYELNSEFKKILVSMNKLVKRYTEYVGSPLNLTTVYDLASPYDENGIRCVMATESIEINLTVDDIYCKHNHAVEQLSTVVYLRKDREGFVELYAFLMDYFLKSGVVLSKYGDVEKGKIDYQAVLELVTRFQRHGVKAVPESLEDWEK